MSARAQPTRRPEGLTGACCTDAWLDAVSSLVTIPGRERRIIFKAVIVRVGGVSEGHELAARSDFGCVVRWNIPGVCLFDAYEPDVDVKVDVRFVVQGSADRRDRGAP